ncbi:MAG: TIGR00266 family protein [Planctomycetales bacterium]|nr:TIGR00266 family protein [Planctomycetales bacterium]
MQHEVLYRPTYSLALVRLAPGEAVIAESGAMVTMRGGVTIETGMRGGLFSALKRKVLGGESFFLNTFRAQGTPGEVGFAPPIPGDIHPHELSGGTLLVTSGCFLASAADVQLDTQWGGAKTFFSREGLFLLRATGRGLLLLSCYGAIHKVTLAPGERYTVDTGHVVAFTDGMGYAVKRVGGLTSTLFSGEGLVCEITGPGDLYVQTRSLDAFLSWLVPKLPGKSS